MGKIAPLGSREMESSGSDARFLFGYEKEDFTRWLVEVDGNCQAKESTRQEVTSFTTWTPYAEWATTKNGDVVWFTTWTVNPPMSWGKQLYQVKSEGSGGYLFG